MAHGLVCDVSPAGTLDTLYGGECQDGSADWDNRKAWKRLDGLYREAGDAVLFTLAPGWDISRRSCTYRRIYVVVTALGGRRDMSLKHRPLSSAVEAHLYWSCGWSIISPTLVSRVSTQGGEPFVPFHSCILSKRGSVSLPC